ncbi:alpha/beta hydrolase [Streptomyces sp. MS1.HAVA.3]|uniref:Alpha/beta hydrolase n=1 Tax=Streptomyces caledonius TaxID=3134107 RepID=A0ABU8UDZ5_9ACTN
MDRYGRHARVAVAGTGARRVAGAVRVRPLSRVRAVARGHVRREPQPRFPGRYAGLEDRAVRQAGALGRWWAWANEPCAAWPARAADPYAGPWNRTPAHPVLVVNAVYDPSTPYRAGQAMAAELAKARLLTLDGYGHTALDNPSTCVKRHVVRYVLTGALPPEGARCGQDAPPFTTAGKPSSRAASPRPDGTGGTGGRWGKAGRPAGPFTPWPLRPPGLFPDRPGWIAVVLPAMTDAAVGVGVDKEDVRSVRRARR